MFFFGFCKNQVKYLDADPLNGRAFAYWHVTKVQCSYVCFNIYF